MLNAEMIYKTVKNTPDKEREYHKKRYDEVNSVEKGELTIFLCQLWEKYNNLCDKIEYEEGWDPREDV